MATTAPPDAMPASQPTYADVTRDVAATLGNPTKVYYGLLAFVITILLIGFGALLY